MLAWGILILTIIDGTNFFGIPPYSVNEICQSDNKTDCEKESFNGPVLSVLTKSFDFIDGIVRRHEPFLIVLSSVAIAIFTGTLWRATTGLQALAVKQAEDMKESLRVANIAAEAAKESADTARKEFFSAHRPRLIVRQISRLEDKNMYGIQYFIYNVGDSPAKIVSVSESVWLPTQTENLRAIPPYGPSIPVGKTLKSGQWMGRLHVPPPDMQGQLGFLLGYGRARNQVVTLNSLDDNSGVLLLGFIEYEDQVGTTRNTAFLRQFDSKTGRFNPINHPDYEYQD